MPAYIKNSFIEARFGPGSIFKPAARVIFFGLCTPGHAICLEIFEDKDLCFLLIDKRARRLVAKVFTDIRYIVMGI